MLSKIHELAWQDLSQDWTITFNQKIGIKLVPRKKKQSSSETLEKIAVQ